MSRTALLIITALLALPLLLWAAVTQPLFFTSRQDSTIQVSADRLSQHVQMLSQTLPPRSLDTDQLDKSAAYIRRHLAAVGKTTDMEYELAGIPYRNISLLLGPKQGERIIIGAHYDSFEGLPGADDNASGVAGLLELARLLRDAPLQQPVQLIAYTLEEPPNFRTPDMGSAVHAQRLSDEGIEVALMISLEMIGYFSDEPGSQEYPGGILAALYPDTGNFIAVAGHLNGMGPVRQVKRAMQSVMEVPVYSFNAPRLLPGIDFSDHGSFWDHGFPAVMITDTAFYRNKAYHSAEDTWERLNYQAMADVVRGVYQAVIEMAATAPP